MKLLVGLTIAVMLCGVSRARADEPFPPLTKPDAIAKEKEGGRHWEVREYDRAIEAYKAGYMIEPSPRFLFNLGFLSNLAGEHVEAIGFLERLKARADLPPVVRAEVERLIADSIAAIEKERAIREAADSSIGIVGPSDAGSSMHVNAVDSQRWYEDWLGWSLVGAGVAGAASGFAIRGTADGLRDDAIGTADQKESSDLLSRADRRELLGNIAIGIGLVAASAGVVKLAITPTVEQTDSRLVVGLRGAW